MGHAFRVVDGVRVPTEPLVIARCVHLGPPTGETRLCDSCGARGEVVPLRQCGVYGSCYIPEPNPNVLLRGVQRCNRGCPAYAPSAVKLVVSANGIGDHLLGLTVAAAWKRDNPGRELVYAVRHTQWAELFGGYDRLTLAHQTGGMDDIHPELGRRGGLHFVEAVAKLPGRIPPPVKPLPADALAWAERFRGVVVLAPLSLGSGAGRNWLLSHWLHLEHLLSDCGRRCVVVCAGGDERRLSSLRSPVLAGMPAVRVAALMRAAVVVMSNESGMGHLAGALGVPCVVLAAQLDAAPIYSVWPTVRVLQGPLPCGGCRWTGPNFRVACNDLCANLQAITPESVLDAALAAIHPLAPDPATDRDLWGHLSRLISPDRRSTMRRFLELLKGPLVVETGCQRADRDYGAGMSSTVFGLFLRGRGRLVSLDNDPKHVEFCRSRTAGLPVEVVPTDSRDWLRSYAGPPIDGLYLDSADTGTLGYQECCLTEAELALPHLSASAVILIDDSPAGGGKGAKAIPFLLAHGWRVHLQGHQTLLERAT